MTYSRTLELPSVPGREFGFKARCPVTLDIELRDRPEGPELSICGNVWTPKRADIVYGGQCYETIERLYPSDTKVQRICAIWRTWHLNGMNAACEHQRAYAAARGMQAHECFTTPNSHVELRYKASAATTTNVGPFTYRETRDISREPMVVDERPDRCFDCGYSYGSAWLHEPLPQHIIEEVRSW